MEYIFHQIISKTNFSMQGCENLQMKLLNFQKNRTNLHFLSSEQMISKTFYANQIIDCEWQIPPNFNMTVGFPWAKGRWNWQILPEWSSKAGT